MDDDPERLNRLLDDLAAERDPRDRVELSAADVELAQTAAFLRAAHGERSTPTEEFAERLGGQLAAAAGPEEHPQPPGPPPPPPPRLPRPGPAAPPGPRGPRLPGGPAPGPAPRP